MTFRIDDLMVSVVPDRFASEKADCGKCTECTKCTRCTQATAPPTTCDDPATGTSECGGHKSSVEYLEALTAQLDDALVGAGR